MSDLATAPSPVASSSTGEGAPPKGPPPPAAAAAAEPDPEPSFELEIDGKKHSLTHTQARTELQKSRAADKRLQDATERKKEADALVKLFEEDPEAALRKAGKDPEKILAALLERKAKQALMTPEQIERAKLEKERDDLKAEKDKREADAKKKADDELDQHNGTAVEAQFIEAADRHGLDKDPDTLADLADIGLELVELLGTRVTAEQIVQEYLRREEEHIVKRDAKLLPKLKGPRLLAYLKTNVGALLKLPPGELLEALGPEGVKAVQDATLTKVPAPGAGRAKPPPPVGIPPRHPENGQFTRHISEAEFNKKKFR